MISHLNIRSIRAHVSLPKMSKPVYRIKFSMIDTLRDSYQSDGMKVDGRPAGNQLCLSLLQVAKEHLLFLFCLL